MNNSKFIETLAQLRQMPDKEFPAMLQELIPAAGYPDDRMCKYVFIYLTTDINLRKSLGQPIELDSMIHDAEEKANVLLLNHPMVDFMKLPGYVRGNKVSMEKREPVKRSESQLAKMREFLAANPGLERRELIKHAVDELGLDKNKANVYVHICLKANGQTRQYNKHKQAA